MITAPTALVTAAESGNGIVSYQVHIYWDGDNAVDESARLISFNNTGTGYQVGSASLSPLGTSGVGNLVLKNENYRFSRHSSLGDASIRPYISGPDAYFGKRIIVFAGYYSIADSTTEYRLPVFTGYIYAGRTDPLAGVLNLELRDNGMKALQMRASNELDWNLTTDELIEKYAELAGIPAVSLSVEPNPFRIRASWLKNDSILTEMRKIAASTNGFLHFDSNGVLKYQTSDSWLRNGVQYSIDNEQFTALPSTSNPDNLCSEVIVEIRPRVLSIPSEVYTLDEPKTIKASSSLKLTLSLDVPAINIQDPDTETGYWFINNAGDDMADHCTIEIVKVDGVIPAQDIDVVITNTHTSYSAVLTQLILYGQEVIGGPSITLKRETGYTEIDRDRTVSGNFAIQTDDQGAFLCDLLSRRWAGLIDVWKIQATDGLPWLEIGDHVDFLDGDNVNTTRDGYIVQIRNNLTPTRFSATYTVVDREHFFPGSTSGARSNYFYIGTHELDDNRVTFS